MTTVKKKKQIPLHKRFWNELTSRQKSNRERSLEVISIARKSKQSLSKIAKNHGISPKTIMNNTNAFKKKDNRLVPKKFDRISRVMKINENGKEKSIEIKDSRTASIIGSYHNAEKQFLNTGDSSKLRKFSKNKIKDSKGKVHKFETNLRKIIKINEGIEEPEFYEIYGD
ncbi:MAG: hypothetical protein IIC67_02000 [Thaumarchaeota archaeon]|nr:hypothetical protein [Nitrososphaerota archaeon]